RLEELIVDLLGGRVVLHAALQTGLSGREWTSDMILQSAGNVEPLQLRPPRSPSRSPCPSPSSPRDPLPTPVARSTNRRAGAAVADVGAHDLVLRTWAAAAVGDRRVPGRVRAGCDPVVEVDALDPRA